MKKDFSTENPNLDQPSANKNVSDEAPNELTIIGEGPVPHAVPVLNDENGAELPQESARLKSNDESHSGKGPRTAIGKAISSRNALKHGIFSNAILATSEWREQYDSLLSGLWDYFEPIGSLEEVLVEKLAVLIWRYRRLIMTETAHIKGIADKVVFEFNSDSKIIDGYPRSEASIERSFDRTLSQLKRIQRMRLGQPVAPPIKLDVSL